jgi:hypothetical protein
MSRTTPDGRSGALASAPSAFDIDLMSARAWLTLLVVSAYMLLNEGFMLILVPPGSGIPIGEIVIVLFAAMLFMDLRQLARFAAAIPLLLLIAYWLIGFGRLAIDAPRHGIWAVRDATNVIESTYLWIGFVVAGAAGFLMRFPRWLGVFLLIAIPYSSLYPFREALIPYAPTVQAPAGYKSPIFFVYVPGSLIPLTAAVWLLVARKAVLGIPAWMLAGALVGFTVVFHQERTVYIEIAFIMAFLAIIQPRTLLRLSGGLIVGAVAMGLVLASGIELTGRLGEKFSLDFMINHLLAIFGVYSEGAAGGAAHGNTQRLHWWGEIWRNLTSDPLSLLFGLGYGLPLTDFVGVHGQIIREPHNSTIAAFGRIGVIGGTLFLAVQVALARVWVEAYRKARAAGDTAWTNTLIVLAAYFSFIWIHSLSQDAFEKPFNAIPYYFCWGVILRYRLMHGRGSEAPR